MILSITILSHYAECRLLFIITLNVIKLNDDMLSVVAPFLLMQFREVQLILSLGGLAVNVGS